MRRISLVVQPAAATDQVRVGHQPQDRQGPRPDDPAVAPAAGGSGDRVMERRTFLTLATGGLLAAPLAAGAQPAGKVYRIGYISNSPPNTPESSRLHEAFRQGLRERGWVEGRNAVIEWRFAEGRMERFPDLAADLVRLKVDLIVTTGGPAARAAKQATTTIPIVAVAVSDPVGQGFVASLARPGGNVTGLATLFPELAVKRLGLLKEILPGVSRVAVLWNAANPGNVIILRGV